ncbi:MAG: hypothetical protein JNL74_01365, partial [Fibrobacteres bacterium]|nr:hypothetical protein [Fibrobacterota bacterium]
QTAAFFGGDSALYTDIEPSCPCTVCSDTLPAIDLFNPQYRVISPNGGETYHPGDTCKIRVRSLKQSNAGLYLITNS